MFEPKIPAIGASIGFVLSLLVGLFSGASFAVMLLRATSMALLFGCLFLFGRMVMLRFIPELFQPAAENTGGGGSVPDTGNFVDITIDESGKDDTLFARNADASHGDMIPDFLESASPSRGVRENGDQTESERTVSSGNAGFQPTDWQKADSIRSDTADKQSFAATAGGLDVLPDLQDFVPQATDTMDDGEESFDSSSSVNTGMINSLFSAPDTTGSSSVESETMVKAIRTILAKDN